MAPADPLELSLERVTAGAVSAVPGAEFASITLLDDTGPQTVAATSEEIKVVDFAQYAAHRGPSIEATTQRAAARVLAEASEDTWPEFAGAAKAAGVRAALAVPLVLAGGEEPMLGSLNLYSADPAAFDPFDKGLMQVFTVAASAAISNAHRWQRSRLQVEQLEFALVSRSDIEQAKGVLMALHGCSADEAFLRLAQESQSKNTKLREVALELLASLRRR
ncbi:GAF and ANTAR domain-containing protein [Prauserella sp. ASG 168]|uniref:GAF and ANTAR domain-containing protein n=2 Tax=Prauserella cavernicola TaxID=2800127 RepID=A0A934QNH2_9PSEU|nr:GAF and ANTAR domain-containing protein [Prauserella cavernicola]